MQKFKEISAKDNRLIKQTALLQKSAKARKESNLFLLEGLRICKDAKAGGVVFDTLIVSKTAVEKQKADIDILAEISENCAVVTDDLFGKISETKTPQGIIAVARIPKSPATVDNAGRYVALEHMADPANIGAVARTAEALGITGLIISGDSCDIYSPKALRASMGTLIRIPTYFCDDISLFLEQNRLRGFACVPTGGDEKIGDVRFANGDAVIIGNEANGLTEKTISGAYKTVTIPMRGKAESLNAAAAAAIAMWELIK